MKLSKKTMPKWLLVPPVVALLLVLGPLSMQGQLANASESPRPESPATQTPGDPSTELGKRTVRPTPALPRTPDLWQMSSALVGVLLLGIGGIVMLRKLRGGATPVRGAAPLMTLRQTMRLSAKQAVHAIEFDDRVLLVGESERGLALLESGRLPDRMNDEAEVLARAVAAANAAEEDGAVPKNLVIPRPPGGPVRRPTAAPAPAPTKTGPLEDFRTLLQKAGRA